MPTSNRRLVWTAELRHAQALRAGQSLQQVAANVGRAYRRMGMSAAQANRATETSMRRIINLQQQLERAEATRIRTAQAQAKLADQNAKARDREIRKQEQAARAQAAQAKARERQQQRELRQQEQLTRAIERQAQARRNLAISAARQATAFPVTGGTASLGAVAGAAALGSAFGPIGVGAAVLAAGFAALSLSAVRASDSVARLRSQIRLVASDVQGTERRLRELAVRTRSDFESVVIVFTRTARALQSLDPTIPLRRTEQFTETISQLVRISGSSAREASGALIQLSQGLASNRLGGEELRSVMEQIPAVAIRIARGMNSSLGEIREMARAGRLEAVPVMESILSQAQDIRKEFETITPLIGDMNTLLGNAVDRLAAAAVNASGIRPDILRLLSNAVRFINFLAEGVEGEPTRLGRIIDEIEELRASGENPGRLRFLEDSLGTSEELTIQLNAAELALGRLQKEYNERGPTLADFGGFLGIAGTLGIEFSDPLKELIDAGTRSVEIIRTAQREALNIERLRENGVVVTQRQLREEQNRRALLIEYNRQQAMGLTDGAVRQSTLNQLRRAEAVNAAETLVNNAKALGIDIDRVEAIRAYLAVVERSIEAEEEAARRRRQEALAAIRDRTFTANQRVALAQAEQRSDREALAVRYANQQVALKREFEREISQADLTAEARLAIEERYRAEAYALAVEYGVRVQNFEETQAERIARARARVLRIEQRLGGIGVGTGDSQAEQIRTRRDSELDQVRAQVEQAREIAAANGIEITAIEQAGVEARQRLHENYARDIRQLYRDTWQSIAESVARAFTSFEDNTRGWINLLLRDLPRLITLFAELGEASQARNALSNSDGGLFSGIAGFFGSLFGGRRQSGGPVRAGYAYLVGEGGPELFVPNSAGQIQPNGGTGGVVINMPVVDLSRNVESQIYSMIPQLQAAVMGLNQMQRA